MPDVMEAPTADAGAIDTAVDTSTIDTSTDTSAGSDTGTTDVIDSADSPQPGEIAKLRGAELYKAVKEKLKAAGLSSEEQRSLRNAIHIASEADKMSGGDLTKFQAEREAYSQLMLEGEESLPREEFIQAVRGDREQLQGILNDISSGAPRLVEELFTDHPESAKSLTTQAMDRLAELDNERFSNYVAKSAVSYLNSQGFQVEFAVMDEFLPMIPDFPGKNRLIQAIQKVWKGFSGLETLASKQIPNPQKPQGDQTPQNGNQQPQDFAERREAWNGTLTKANSDLFVSEMTKAAGTRKVTLTEQEKTQIRAAVKDEFDARLGANRAYGQAMQGYLANGNRKAYSERVASEGKKLLPSIVARHTNAAIDKRTQAKAPTNGTKTPPTPTQRTQTTGTNGNLVQWLSGPPKTVGKQVDYMRTSNSMLVKGEAYLKGEKGLFRWKAKSVSPS